MKGFCGSVIAEFSLSCFNRADAAQNIAVYISSRIFTVFIITMRNIIRVKNHKNRIILITHIDAVFKTTVPMPAGEQREKFQEIVSSSLEEKNSFDLVQGIHEQLSERIILYKESKDPEPMKMSAEEMIEIVENSGANDRQIEDFRKSCREMLGEDGVFSPANITDPKKMVIETPEIRITVDPQYSHLISTELIDGRKYILIAADNGVEINGIGVEIG